MSDPEKRLLLIGPSRSGSTFLAATLTSLGVSFGFESRAWDIDSGFYEHPRLFRAYASIRKYQKIKPISDRLSEFFYQRAVRLVRPALSGVQALKFPPISNFLPGIVSRCGYEPIVAICLRKFEGYCLSRIRKEGVDFRTCKQDYLNVYSTALCNYALYGGVVFCFDELTHAAGEAWIAPLEALSGAPAEQVRALLQATVRPGRHALQGYLVDAECDQLYERIKGLGCRSAG